MGYPDQAPPSEHLHAVRFYKDSDSLSRIVAEFVGQGFVRGVAGIVIATAEHRNLIAGHLRERGFDVSMLERRGDLIMLDARDTLAQFCRLGEIDEQRFAAVITPVIERASRGRTDVPVRAYGELVDLLWKDGMPAASIRLEMLWNQLANTHHFRLLCGYSMGNFYKDASVEEITCTHTHVMAADGQTRAIHRV